MWQFWYLFILALPQDYKPLCKSESCHISLYSCAQGGVGHKVGAQKVHVTVHFVEFKNHLWNASYWKALPDTYLLSQYLYTVRTKIWAKRYRNLKASPSFSHLGFSEVVLLFHSKTAWFLPFLKSGLHFRLRPTARFLGSQVAALAGTHAHTH